MSWALFWAGMIAFANICQKVAAIFLQHHFFQMEKLRQCTNKPKWIWYTAFYLATCTILFEGKFIEQFITQCTKYAWYYCFNTANILYSANTITAIPWFESSWTVNSPMCTKSSRWMKVCDVSHSTGVLHATALRTRSSLLASFLFNVCLSIKFFFFFILPSFPYLNKAIWFISRFKWWWVSST